MHETIRLKLLISSLFLLCLVGCAGNPQKKVVLPSNPPTTETTAVKTLLPFSLSLPAQWEQRCTVSYTLAEATVSIDGQESFTVTYTDNAPGAKALDLALVEDGYTYFAEDGAHFFYYKFHEEVPEELISSADSWNMVEERNNELESELEIFHEDTRREYMTSIVLRSLFRFGESSGICDSALEFRYGTIECQLTMKTETYINYRMNTSITIPADMLGDCKIIIDHGNDHHIGMYTLEGSRRYMMCEFAACPVESSIADWYQFVGKHTIVEDTLYVSENYWRDPVDNRGLPYILEFSWTSYPNFIKTRFTFEEVQQIVDSFTILSDTPDSGD